MSYVGINIGALTVKVVALSPTGACRELAPHQGRPVNVLKELLARAEFADAQYFGVSGQLGHISEVAAIQRALQECDGDFDAVASLGGESFLVYFVSERRIGNVLSHNKCAAGSGEFFVQQIGRMGLDIDEAIQRSFHGKVVPLASRCSVHCKSDITHKLNRKEAAPEDILHTLHDSMASKVASLLEKGKCELRRVLLIGGVSRNAALLAALQQKLPKTEFVVLPESPCFEAWGSALLTRDEPKYTSPRISVQPNLTRLPPLKGYADRVRVIDAPRQRTPPDGPLVLGLDAGSTTTKAVLLDPRTRDVVASHYIRTQGDPVQASRECLRIFAERHGNLHVGLIGTTGSAREVTGAYLGTDHVYNEISAHAAGAAHFDPEVDTIFEIGGQDAKYIHLRNGVPIDYAMNNACSAGTGSFLEESAQGDLGIGVSDISQIALDASCPVQFKATCAAFINSDIRIAQQQGHARDDIVAGLVYSIASNYLTKVKGPRHVGRKVFLQGGVALNHSLGHAFAHSVGRQIVIPPNPELLGALGVALLALERSGGSLPAETDLAALSAPEMKSVGTFACGACGMHCTIDRFEVDGRRFPFGGRCSLFENVWKKKSHTEAAPDLVERRTALLFGGPIHCETNGGQRNIGIPRALTTHSLYPLYSTFLSQLGLNVVLSGIDPQGELKSYSGFCFPAQIAHGAVLNLASQGAELVFFPHVVRMPQSGACADSHLCPITQAGPYFLAKAFPEVRFLSPQLDFSRGYETESGLVEMATDELKFPRQVAERAWQAAVAAQAEAERALHELGREALAKALSEEKPAILLAGRSYNAFTPEASQSVGKKLSSMGFTVIPADCLVPEGDGPTAWHFSNQILNAVALAKRHPNLFLLCVSNFSCTIDAFTHARMASEMGSKPYLILEIDAHTADAGVQTRLEAFLDIIRNYRGWRPNRSRQLGDAFTACRLERGGRLFRSSGEQVPLTDPRVKLFLPTFSQYHSQAVAMLVGWFGMHAGDVIPLDRNQLERGLQYTSGRECLPLPICVGQILYVHENRQPGDIAGLYMLRSGSPCVSDAYMGYLERFVAEQQLPDVFLFNPREENDYYGLDKIAVAQRTSAAILVADILVEIEQVLRVAGAAGSIEQLQRHWEEFTTAATSFKQFRFELQEFVRRLAALPRARDPATCPRVVVTGDFFTRFSPFFMEGIHDAYARNGIILKPIDLSDLILYDTYHGVTAAAHDWGMKPGLGAVAKACTRIFHSDGRQYLQNWLGHQVEKSLKNSYRRLFRKTGLLVAGNDNTSSQFDHASKHVSTAIYGEVIPTVGQGLQAGDEGYDGMIVIGPFNCLPFRVSEAILKPLSIQLGMPILTYESDGYAVSPSFVKQVDVHIQQVLEHAARNAALTP